MTADNKKSARQSLEFLKFLVQPGATCIDGPANRFRLMRNGKSVMTPPARLVEKLLKEGLIARQESGFCLTSAGRVSLSKQNESGFRRRQPVERRTLKNADGAPQEVTLHVGESPLAWLRTRKDKDGASLLSEMQFLAGEKLRADFTRAQLMPRVTASWDMSRARAQRGVAPVFEFSDNTLAAKTRITDAMKAVGPELAGILFDVCCFLKGLTAVEMERRWPARTAKVVLALALDRLAAHYGLSAEAEGKQSGAIRRWGAEDYRPEIVY